MRSIGVILCAMTFAGCAARPQSTSAPTASHESTAIDDDAAAPAVTASALVFDPPVAAGFPALELARAEREPAAFVAYEDVQTTYFYLRLDDRQKIDNDGRSERRVISETFGISRR